jgi:hypothetical protein
MPVKVGVQNAIEERRNQFGFRYFGKDETLCIQ